MDPPKKNKKTLCSPKLKAERNCPTENSSRAGNSKKSRTPCKSKDIKQSPLRHSSSIHGNLNTSATIKNKGSIGNSIADLKQSNYNPQQIANTPVRVPDRISKEKNQDQLYYAAANSQIFQAKVAYFPGKNLQEIQHVLNENIKNDRWDDKFAKQNFNLMKRITCGAKEKIFGKHLIPMKKKVKKMKISLTRLNPIEEANESDRSNESLKKKFAEENFEMVSPMTLSHKISLQPSNSMNSSSSRIKLMKEIDESDKNQNYLKNEKSHSIVVSKSGQQGVSYMFQQQNTITKNEKQPKKLVTTEEMKTEVKTSLSKVFQIRDMFENMSKTCTAKNAKKFVKSSSNSDKIFYKHTISCEECRKILKDMIKIDDSTNREQAMKSVISELPIEVVRQIINSLVSNICANADDRKSTISVKIETNKSIYLSKDRRMQKKNRKPQDLNNQLDEKKTMR